MGFHAYSSPYDWSRIAGFKATAKTVPGGMIDLSVGSPVDPVPSSVQQALVAGADAPNAHGYPVTAGTADLKAAIDTWFREQGDERDHRGRGIGVLRRPAMPGTNRPS